MLQAELRRAIKEGEIEIHYQPIMRLADGSVIGIDVRWRNARRGWVDPDEFAVNAEENGMIETLVLFAHSRASADLARWQRNLLEEGAFFVSVNVAWRYLPEPDFAKDFSAAITDVGFARRLLRLKVTESAEMAENGKSWSALKSL